MRRPKSKRPGETLAAPLAKDSLDILLLTSSYPRHSADHAGSFVRGFAQTLTSAGHRVTVLRPDSHESIGRPLDTNADLGVSPEVSPGASPDASPDADREAGAGCHPNCSGAPAAPPPSANGPHIDVQSIRYHLLRSRQRLFYGAGAPENLGENPLLLAQVPLYMACAMAKVLRLAAGKDLLISHWLAPSGILCAAASGLLGIPHLAVAHSGDVAYLEKLPFGGKATKAILSNTQGLMVTGKGMARRLSALVPPQSREARLIEEALVLPMGIPLDPDAVRYPMAKSHARQVLGLPCSLPGPSGVTVLSLGRLVPVKGGDVLLRAASRLSFGTEILFAGEGPQMEPLRRLASQLGVSATFLGNVANETKRAALAAADVVAFPSRILPGGRSEGTPVALLEAMAWGKPVVASEVGGIPEVVVHGREGYLVPPDKPASLADALECLALNPALMKSMGRAAMETGAQFDWASMAGRIDGLVRGAALLA